MAGMVASGRMGISWVANFDSSRYGITHYGKEDFCLNLFFNFTGLFFVNNQDGLYVPGTARELRLLHLRLAAEQLQRAPFIEDLLLSRKRPFVRQHCSCGSIDWARRRARR